MNEVHPARRVAVLAALVSLALGLSALERLIPMPAALPGIKLGLANLVTLTALYLLDAPSALFVSVGRVLLAGFLFGSFASILYALAGALAAFLTMVCFKRFGAFTAVGVSIVGGAAHNAAQLLVAALTVQTAQLKWYLPPLLVAGALCGLVNGLVGLQLIRRIPLALRR